MPVRIKTKLITSLYKTYTTKQAADDHLYDNQVLLAVKD